MPQPPPMGIARTRAKHKSNLLKAENAVAKAAKLLDLAYIAWNN